MNSNLNILLEFDFISKSVHRLTFEEFSNSAHQPCFPKLKIYSIPDPANQYHPSERKCQSSDITLRDGAGGDISSLRFRVKKVVVLGQWWRSQQTSGTWGIEVLNFVKEFGQRISRVSQNSKSTAFLIQRISITLQRGNVNPRDITLRGAKDPVSESRWNREVKLNSLSIRALQCLFNLKSLKT
ncbi:hypothetical protein C0J52_03353 [Blattella germanica]|nr:hypothetical protein C0J52_03353 [Blattella germanica]